MEEDSSSTRPRVQPIELREEAEACWDEPALPSCLGLDIEIFYGPYQDLREEPPDDRQVRENEARSICEGCSLEVRCLWNALQREEPFGVWGGLSHQERADFLKWLKNRTTRRGRGKRRVRNPAPTTEAELEPLVRQWVFKRTGRPYNGARPLLVSNRGSGVRRHQAS